MNPLRRAQQELAEQRAAQTVSMAELKSTRDAHAARLLPPTTRLVRECARRTSLTEVADALGSNRTHVSRWANAKVIPHARGYSRLVALAIQRLGPQRVQDILEGKL